MPIKKSIQFVVEWKFVYSQKYNYITATYICSFRSLEILSKVVNDPHIELANWSLILIQ